MARALRLLQVLVIAALVAGVFAAGADASRGPCVPGKKKPLCYHWQAKVTFVADGDTIDVNIVGDGSSAVRRVRLTGINAMEQTVYSRNPSQRRGYCHSLAATARLQGLIARGGKRVRLSAQNPSSRSGHRLRRAVAIRSGGHWVDVGRILVDEGHVLPHANAVEWARNARYALGAQRAARKGLRLWDTNFCGNGPSEGAKVQMWVNWDADGTDGRHNVNGEWIRIKNRGSSELPIGGWWVRDSNLLRFKFPRGSVIPAKGRITIYMGSRPGWDQNRRTHFYWRQQNAVFQNVSRRRGMGDGGYLFDRQGDLRFWMMYPCRTRCGSPLQGKVTVRAHPRKPERVLVRNVSSGAVALEGYVVDNFPYNYSFRAGTHLQPGEALRLVVKGSPRRNSRLVRYWGKTKYILNDPGDRVILRTQQNVRIGCFAWGRMRC